MSPNLTSLHSWLRQFDRLPLECDGLSRVISTLLHREGIDHQLMAGSLTIVGVGRIGLHWWIELPEGAVVDFRARMWLGDDEAVPHGLFERTSAMTYDGSLVRARLDPMVFFILTGTQLDQVGAFPVAGAPDLEDGLGGTHPTARRSQHALPIERGGDKKRGKRVRP